MSSATGYGKQGQGQVVNKAWNFAHVLRDDGLCQLVLKNLRGRANRLNRIAS